MRPARLRVPALGAVVSIAVLVLIAATAGPSGTAVPEGGAKGGASDGAKGATSGRGLLAELGLTAARTTARTSGLSAAPSPSPVSSSGTHCGPELASPDGVEAQTCVVSEGADTWARTYYRNATGQALDAVLTLMAPGRTVQVRCAAPARDDAGTCETPRERRRRGAVADHEDYSAVAEFAGAGEGDSTPLLLRSGSNTAEPEGS
ncbi:hypothetical protein ACFYU9_23175 [Streptomyces sp. NPDC004327]|uniref:hypothetical protein n=1 Tax=Streptomyces sp. NPDC004327 TaxID=3364699 RepID=UPI0036A7E3DA